MKQWFIPIYRGELKCTLSSYTDDFDTIEIDRGYLRSDVPRLKHKLEILDWYYSIDRAKDSRFHLKEISIELPAIQSDYVNDYSVARTARQGTVDLVIMELPEETSFKGFNSVNRIALARNKRHDH